MTVAPLYLGAIWATIKRDASIFASYRIRSLAQVVGMLFSLTMFFYIAKLVRPDAVGVRQHYFAYVVVGVVIVGILTAALTSAQSVRFELMQGNFERMMISPAGPVGGVIALAAFPITYSILVAGSMLVLAIGIFSVPLHFPGIPLALVAVGLGTLGFAAVGLLFVAALLAFKSATGTTWVMAGMSLLGGAYFPIRLFPAWLLWVSQVQPFTPCVDLVRHLLIGTAPMAPVSIELLKLGGFAAGLLPTSFAALWLAVHFSRRRGTITEY